MPVMVKLWGGPPESTRTRSPTRKWYFVAVPLSITTSSRGAAERCPATSRTDDSRRLGSNENPNAEPAPPIALPPDTNWA